MRTIVAVVCVLSILSMTSCHRRDCFYREPEDVCTARVNARRAAVKQETERLRAETHDLRLAEKIERENEMLRAPKRHICARKRLDEAIREASRVAISVRGGNRYNENFLHNIVRRAGGRFEGQLGGGRLLTIEADMDTHRKPYSSSFMCVLVTLTVSWGRNEEFLRGLGDDCGSSSLNNRKEILNHNALEEAYKNLDGGRDLLERCMVEDGRGR